MCLFITQGLTSLHLKEHHSTQEWLKSRCTNWRVQQEWCLFSCKFLWKRALQQTNTPERFCFVGHGWLQSSILQTSRSFLCSGTFSMLSLSYKVISIQERCCVQTDGTHQDRNSGKDEWSSWGCCWLCEHYRWFMDSQSLTLFSLCCDSWDEQWHQEPLSLSFLCHL